MAKLHLGVLGSGAGSNMQSIVDAIEAGTLDAEIRVVLADVPDAKILDRAKRHGIPCQYLDCAPWKTKLEGPAEDRCIDILREAGVDTVVLAGFMTILGKRVIQAFENRIINIHPALIPSFCGEGYYGLRVHEEALKKGVKVTGATAHFVNEICDGGPIIIQRAVEVKSGDTPEILQRRVMDQAEWHILPQAVNLFCNDKIKVIGNTTEILE